MPQQQQTPPGDYTLVSADDTKVIYLNGSAARTLTGPATTPFGVSTGYYVDACVVGATDCTFAPQGAGATIDGSATKTLAAGKTCRLHHTGGNTWRTTLGA